MVAYPVNSRGFSGVGFVDKIGKYNIVEKIGVGGFGEVYKGYDPFIKRNVAVKTCSSHEQEIRTRFFQEAEIAGNLNHRNVTTIYDFGVQDDLPYLIQEYLSGEDLDRKIKRRDFLPYPEKLYYLLQIARGLAYAHSRGVIHRDIKPANIRVLEDGTTKIMDFGIAKLAQRESTLTQTGMTLGTAAYLAPEQIQGENIDHRTDIFSYGVLAYELLTYHRPFQGKQISAVLYEILNSQPTPIPELWPGAPPAMVQIIESCLEKDPSRRFSHGNELLRELEQVQKEGRRERIEDGATVQMTPAALSSAGQPLPPNAPPPHPPADWMDRTPSHSQSLDLMDRTPSHSQGIDLMDRTPSAIRQPSAPYADLPGARSGATPTLDDIDLGGSPTESTGSERFQTLPPRRSSSNLARILPLLLLALAAAGAGWWYGNQGTAAPPDEPPLTIPPNPETQDVGGEETSPSEETVVDVTSPVGTQQANSVDTAPDPGMLMLVAPQWTGAMKVRVGNTTYNLKRNKSLELPPNTYTAHFEIDEGGYQATNTVRINLEAGSTRRISSPIPAPGGLSVRPFPGRPQGRVLLSAQDLGSSPIRRRLLAPGMHSFTLRAADGSETRHEVEIQSGQETVVSFDLTQGRVVTSTKPLSR